MVDCRESRELMSGAVDNQLLKNESQGFYEHIEICGSCKDEFDLERLTKAYIRRKITLVDVPYDLEQAIMAQLFAEGGLEFNPGFFTQLFSSSIFQPVMAVGVMFVLAIILFYANKPNLIMPTFPAEQLVVTAPSQQDGLSLAENNFQDVLSGKFKPQVTAIDMADVASFIKQNAGYAIPLPTVPSADWVGGSVSSQNGNKVARVVYKMGENFIYIYSFPKQLMNSKNISLPSNCVDAINKNAWFWTMDSDGDTQAVWSYDDHVCIATANLGKNDLVGYLKTESGAEQQ